MNMEIKGLDNLVLICQHWAAIEHPYGEAFPPEGAPAYQPKFEVTAIISRVRIDRHGRNQVLHKHLRVKRA